MAGNRPGDNSGNILVEFDYNNIIVVDPNKTIDAFGNIRERLVDHENMVMFANLEAEVLPRTKLAVGASVEDTARVISVAKINFLRPTEGTSLTSSYYDELTGKNSRNGLGDNQVRIEQIQPNNGDTPYNKVTVVNPGGTSKDNGLLGITSINVTTNTSFIPTVTIELEDVQGRALFQLGDDSPYSAFFNLPYPPFYLTLKGYYGQAIKYQLNLRTFNARFNSFSGNYSVTLEFVGYKFNILNEISMGHLLAAPHMYSTRFDISKSATSIEGGNKNIESQTKQTGGNVGQSTTGQNNITTQIVSEKGYQKVVEVYSEYKAKGLLEPDFPELTFAQFMNSLENLEKNIINTYDKVDVEPLTNIRAYKETLKNYYNEIYGSDASWYNTFMNPKSIVLKDGTNVYAFKNEIDVTKQQNAKTLLSGYTIEYNKLLAENPTLGTVSPTPIKNSITYNTLLVNVNLTDIDLDKTTQNQVGRTIISDEDKQITKDYLTNLLSPQLEFTLNQEAVTNPERGTNLVIQPLFIFKNNSVTNLSLPRFENLIYQMEAEANRKLSEYEEKLTADFQRKIEDPTLGIGFKPTVRNVSAVIMASAEAFIRLMDEVHTNAWNVKYDPIRRLAILNNPSSAPGVDTTDNYKTSNESENLNQGLSTGQIPVYPWPQYFEETPEDKKGRFQLKYIGDPSVVDTTKGYLYDKWPEVEFVEEYMRGLTQKFNPPIAQVPTDSQATTNIININAIEYPSNGIAYANKEEIKFFYEIWERQFLTSNYSGFIRANNNQLSQLTDLVLSSETSNIVTSLGVSSPFLTLKLKNYDITAQNYEQFLSNISNQGTGRAYQEYIRDFFVTPYIRNLTENSFNILTTNELGKEPQIVAKYEALEQLVKNVANDPLIIDTYPFTNPTWVSDNMSQSDRSKNNEVYNTKQVLTVFKERNVISNFNSIYDYTTNRPVTNFSYLNVTNPTVEVSETGLNVFYSTRKNPNKFVPTEGYVTYIRSINNVTTETTTSMLNTPYMVNAIQNGVFNWRKKDKYPYVQAAYLFINSLPLASLRERYQTDGSSNELDYIASCFKKFGAIHKMPYAWVLKMGSVWYRYKTYKTTGIDFLDTAWTDFDYKGNFDPVTSSDTKTYKFEFDGDKNITLQNTTDPTIQKIQTGFYPKVINDFNVFYNGYDLYVGYTDQEIQSSVNGGMKVYNFTDSNIIPTSSNVGIATGSPTTSTIQTWSVILPDTVMDLDALSGNCSPNQNTTSIRYFVVPSFGSPINQVSSELLQNNVQNIPLLNDPSIYNGSVRMLWAAPNYGYFDNTQIVKPSPDKYVNKILTADTKQSAFRFLITDEYSNIEEIFSVFDKGVLDKFEQEFLNFSKPIADIDLGPQVSVPIGESPVDNNAVYRNFQYLFRDLMSIDGNTNQTNTEYFNSIANVQLSSFSTTIKSFLEYDVILKYGNPANYKRRVVDSFIKFNGGPDIVTDPINFGTYIPNTLPSVNGTITLAQSKAQFPQQWLALETEIGFSTIQNLVYTDQGSYITDFFIDNNIEFSVSNITLCSQLIKQYATQKLLTPDLNSNEFKSRLQTYLGGTSAIQNLFLNQVLNKVRAELPNQQQLPEKSIQSVIDGQQSKVENYEVFKALNDKWIAGGDFNSKTLFEDFLFLDRASRNIGDTIIVDIISLKETLLGTKTFEESSLNMEMSVFTFLSGILIKNKFNVMPLPAYVNFYNVQDVDGTTISQNSEGSLEFADNMWGTFLDVDYRKSGPKMVCFYAGLPSAHLDLPKGNSRFRSDSFELRRASENPLIENQQGKKDWAVSNRCVGFNVDIGTRNQNIFYSFSVSMDSGKATSETIQTQLNMVDQANGKNTATQNVGLYNLYKQRSYQCNIVSFGNALIQPTMYFNLRHVPMFNGPYLITSVNHVITAGEFQTSFTGVRQGIYDLPSIDTLLQSINQNLLTQIESAILTKKDNIPIKPTTNINKSALLSQQGDNTAATVNSCTEKLNTNYSTWGDFRESATTGLNPLELADAIRNKTDNPDLQVLIYLMCYIKTFNKDKFYGYNNNFVSAALNVYWGPSTQYFIQKQASCVQIPNSTGAPSSTPIANFEDIDKFLSFMVARLTPNINRIFYGENGDAPLGLPKYYACFWSPSTSTNQNIPPSYFDENQDEFKTLFDTVKKGIKSAGEVQLNVASAKTIKTAGDAQAQQIASGGKGATNNLNTSNPPPPSCLPPKVTSFSPLTGVTGTILNLTGTDLGSVTAVTVNGITTTTGITINNPTNIVSVIVPFINNGLTNLQSNPISVGGIHGSGTTTNTFTYNPLQTSPVQTTTIPGAPPNVNTQPQQTGPLPLIEDRVSDSNGSFSSLTVSVNPAAGNWNILPEFVEWDYKMVANVNGPNNTVEQVVIDSQMDGNQFASNVTTNQQQFILDSTEVINKLTALTSPEEVMESQFVFNTISITAVSPNKYDKYNITNDYKDIIPDAYQSFRFTVIL
jgi:hypothetical protein